MKEVSVFAPASCGNVCVGYDILGLCYEGAGDTVIVRKLDTPEVKIKSITGVTSKLPLDCSKNTAGIVLLELIKDQGLDFGFEIEIEKGIPLGSGMGGSAASAVGALVGANQFLDKKLSNEKLLEYSLKGEELSSGHGHADNTAPCLYGGLTLVRSNPLEIVQVPFPKSITLLLTLPGLSVETKKAREVLKPNYQLSEYAEQSANLAGFLCGCYQDDIELIKKSFKDVLVEPYRAKLTEGFSEIQQKANSEGLIGHSLSGSGPAQITLCSSPDQANKFKETIKAHYERLGIPTTFYMGPINNEGAKVL